MRKIAVVTLAIAMMLCLALCSTASAASYKLLFGHTLTENDAFHKAMVAWAEAVREDTNGEVEIEIYPNAELGSEEDVLEQMRQGAGIGWQTDFGRAGSYVTELSVMNAPYFIGSLEEAEAIQSSATMNGYLEELANTYGLRALSFEWVQGNRVVFSNKAATNPQEMAAMSVRTANAPIWLESVKSLGCTAVPLAYGEIYSSMQTKVVDGCELPYNAALSLSIQEVAKYIIETNHIFQMNLMLVSEDWWQGLPDAYKQILIDDCNAAGRAASEELAATADQSKQIMVDAGMTLIGHEELDEAAFIEASQSAYDALGLSEVRAAVYSDIGK